MMKGYNIARVNATSDREWLKKKHVALAQLVTSVKKRSFKNKL